MGGEEIVGEREGEVEEEYSYSFSSYIVSTTPRCFQAFIFFLASLPIPEYCECYDVAVVVTVWKVRNSLLGNELVEVLMACM